MDRLPPFAIPHRKHRPQLVNQLLRAQMIINPGYTSPEDLRRVAETTMLIQNDVTVCIQLGYLVGMAIEDPLLFALPAIRAECGDEEEFGCHVSNEIE